VREVNGLRGWAGVLSRDWVGEGRRCLEVRQAVDVSFLLHFILSLLFFVPVFPKTCRTPASWVFCQSDRHTHPHTSMESFRHLFIFSTLC